MQQDRDHCDLLTKRSEARVRIRDQLPPAKHAACFFRACPRAQGYYKAIIITNVMLR